MQARILQTTGRVLGSLMPETAAGLAEQLTIRPRLTNRRHSTAIDADARRVTFRYGLRGLRWGLHGPVVLALHGWRGRANQFASIAKRLTAKGFQVLAIEAPGHAPHSGALAHPGLFVDALAEVMVELGEIDTLIGHSMGAGAVLMALAQGHSARRAVAIAGPAGYGGVLNHIANGLGLSGPARQRYLAKMEDRTGFRLVETQANQLMPRVRVPVLLAHDRADPVVPFASAIELDRHGHQTTLHVTEGMGHSRILHDLNTVEVITQFIHHSQE